MGAYNYVLKYRKGEENGNADFCSRFPLNETPFEPPEPADVILLFDELAKKAITSSDIAKETNKDRILARVKDLTAQGWPLFEPSCQQLYPYFKRKDELSVDRSCVLWGNRVIVPKTLQKNVLEELHEAHPGMVKMKRIARSYVWWPTLDLDIEATVNECYICQQEKPKTT